jgi:hypothetical protein
LEAVLPIRVEVRNLAGRLGEVCLDPGHATAWDLASQVHLNFPLPCGVLWKLAIENELVTDKNIPIVENSVVTCVKLVPAAHEQIGVVSQVEQLLLTGASVDDLSLQSHLMWNTLESVTFGSRFNQSIADVTLPSGLQSLTFGRRFNQSMDHVTLPSGLQSLTFGVLFNQSIGDVTLPSGLQSLTFGNNFNQSMDNVILPSGLQSLTFGQFFNQSIDNVTFPSGLQSLTLHAWYNQSIGHVTLPCGLQVIYVEDGMMRLPGH